MSKMKKIMSTLLAVAMMASVGTSVMASEVGETQSNSEYFSFASSDARMSSDGSFSFQFSNGLDSDTFKPTKSSITVEMTATSTQAKELFYVYVGLAYSDGGQMLTVRADGTKKTFTVSGLDTSKRYQLFFRNDIFDAGTTTVTGSGKVSNVSDII